jgi:hypothetical protein
MTVIEEGGVCVCESLSSLRAICLQIVRLREHEALVGVSHQKTHCKLAGLIPGLYHRFALLTQIIKLTVANYLLLNTLGTLLICS